MDPMTQGTGGVEVGCRHMAILWIDLYGFAWLVDSEGPEQAVEAVAPLMSTLVGLVRAHDGDIQRILADGFMSVFGLHAQDGNEVVRAVRAGAELVSAAAELSGGPPVRVGIECGEVVVSRSWEAAGFTVWGQAVTVAKRLRDVGGPGTINIGPRAVELARQVVTFTPPVYVHLDGLDGDSLANSVSSRDISGRSAPSTTVQRPVGGGRRAGGVLRPALTRSESAVARLVAQGLSNPQIARELHISRYTAETHMRHIFAKLGVSSRAELAAMIARLVAVIES